VRGKVTGYGWLASSGEFGLQGFPHSRKQIGPEVVLVAELRAIGKAVHELRGRDITLLIDSKPAVAMVKRWMAGDDVLPQGEPLNEGADALARLASRYVLGRSGLDADEYRRRAEDLAQAFSAEFNRLMFA
jgi:hypothetical protein